MPTSLKQKLAIAAAAMAGLGAGTLGVTSAFASPTKPAAAVQAPAPQTPAPQSQSSTAPDTAAEATAEAPGAAESTTADPANEPGVVGTGHEDPAGQNVDNQFQGAQ